MPTKRHPTQRAKSTRTLKANLGQKEAELESTGKELMSHMGSGKVSKPARRQRSKRRTK
jgi:hypothetical protein